MNAKRSVATGFAAALLIGGGGGLGIEVLASSMVPERPPEPESATANATAGRVVVEKLRGRGYVLTPDGHWRPVQEGERFGPGVTLRSAGASGLLEAVTDNVRVALGQDAHAVFAGVDQVRRVHLARGAAIVTATAPFEVALSSVGIAAAGTSFGASVHDGRVVVAAIEAEAEIRRAGGETEKIAVANELVLGQGKRRPGPMPGQLTVDIERGSRRRDRNEITGTTSPLAAVFVRRGRVEERVKVAYDGRFATWIAGDEPAPGELVAIDAAGRTAEVGKPSVALGQAPSAPALPPAEVVEETPEAKKEEAPPPAPEPAAPIVEEVAAPAAAPPAPAAPAAEEAKAEPKPEEAAAAPKERSGRRGRRGERAEKTEKSSDAVADESTGSSGGGGKKKRGKKGKGSSEEKPKDGFSFDMPSGPAPPGATQPSKAPDVEDAPLPAEKKKEKKDDEIELDWE